MPSNTDPGQMQKVEFRKHCSQGVNVPKRPQARVCEVSVFRAKVLPPDSCGWGLGNQQHVSSHSSLPWGSGLDPYLVRHEPSAPPPPTHLSFLKARPWDPGHG